MERMTRSSKVLLLTLAALVSAAIFRFVFDDAFNGEPAASSVSRARDHVKEQASREPSGPLPAKVQQDGRAAVATGTAGDGGVDETAITSIERRFYKAFNESTDLHEVATDALKLSKQGDPAASFVVYEIQSFCQSATERFATTKALKEQLIQANNYRPEIRDLMKQEYAMCRRISEIPGFPKDARSELVEAAGKHHPPAIIELMVQSDDARPVIGSNADSAAMLARSAVKEKHPAAAWKMQHLDLPLDRDSVMLEERTQDRLAVSAWRLLACRQGYPCDEKARWVRLECAYKRVGCQQNATGREYLRELLGRTRFEQAQALADRLENAIENREWNKLGL